MKKLRLLFIMIICSLLFVSCTLNQPQRSKDKSTEEEIITEEFLSDKLDAVIASMESATMGSANKEQTTEEVNAPEYDDAGYEILNDTVYTTDMVNVRKEPSTDAEIIIKLETGVKLSRIGTKDDWSKITLNDEICYVATEFLMLSTDGENKPAALGKVVVIDAGHQKTANNDVEKIAENSNETKPKMTAGTVGSVSGMAEYQITIAAAQKLRSVLEERGYTVIMTRESNDVNISNRERALLAKDSGVLISLHADDDNDKEKSGVYAICATQGNSHISTYVEAKSLATKILNKMAEKSGAKNQGVLENDKLAIINWSKIPTIIIELGYMSNAADDKNMADEAYRLKLVEGIADGLDQYFEDEEAE